MTYLTDTEYQNRTGRNVSEATSQRIKMASRLLDTRIGNLPRHTSGTYQGWKLDLDELNDYQVDIVKDWVAFMVKALFQSDDSSVAFKSIKLGRFSLSKDEDDGDIPEDLRYADTMLKDAHIINRKVNLSGQGNLLHDPNRNVY